MAKEYKTYADKLKSPKWQRKRLEIMHRDKFTCRKCGDEETTLNVHHKVYYDGNDPWDYDNADLITLCEDCHNSIEKIKKSYPDVDFKDIKIYKSDSWDGGSKIIFTSYNGICGMEIYDDNNSYIAGYNLCCETILDIVKIFKHTLRSNI